jgi:hypothetical protein
MRKTQLLLSTLVALTLGLSVITTISIQVYAVGRDEDDHDGDSYRNGDGKDSKYGDGNKQKVEDDSSAGALNDCDEVKNDFEDTTFENINDCVARAATDDSIIRNDRGTPPPPQPMLRCTGESQLNEETGKCEVESSLRCTGEGQELNEATGQCEVDAQLECEEGELNEATGQCEVDAQLECEEGELNEATGQCEVDAQLECEDGQEPNEAGQCDVGDPTCSTGTFNPVSDRCDVADPLCPNPSTYNSRTDRCERPATGGGTNCPGGYAGPENGVCHRPATCPTGSTLNPATDKCQSQTVNPSCSTGTFNPTTDQCEEAAEFGCENDTEPVGDPESPRCVVAQAEFGCENDTEPVGDPESPRCVVGDPERFCPEGNLTPAGRCEVGDPEQF